MSETKSAQVLALLGGDLTQKQIAVRVGVSEGLVSRLARQAAAQGGPVQPVRDIPKQIKAALLAKERQADIARRLHVSTARVAQMAFAMRAAGTLPPLEKRPKVPAGRKKNVLPDETRAAIVAALKERVPTYALTKRFKLATRTINAVEKAAIAAGELEPRAAGPARKSGRTTAAISDERKQSILTALKNDVSMTDVAARFGVSRSTVRRIMEEAGRVPGRVPGRIGHRGLDAQALKDQTQARLNDPASRKAIVDQVREMAGRGCRLMEMARAVDLLHPTLIKLMADEGIERVRVTPGMGPDAPAWSPQELAALRAAAPLGIQAVLAAVAQHRPGEWNGHRTVSAVNAAAYRLGITIAVAPEDAAPEGAGVSFDDLRADQCRWPVGKGPDGRERFCGARRDAGAGLLRRHYCAEHGARASVVAQGQRAGRALAEQADLRALSGRRPEVRR